MRRTHTHTHTHTHKHLHAHTHTHIHTVTRHTHGTPPTHTQTRTYQSITHCRNLKLCRLTHSPRDAAAVSDKRQCSPRALCAPYPFLLDMACFRLLLGSRSGDSKTFSAGNFSQVAVPPDAANSHVTEVSNTSSVSLCLFLCLRQISNQNKCVRVLSVRVLCLTL